MEMPNTQIKRSILLGYFTKLVSENRNPGGRSLLLSKITEIVDKISNDEISKRIFRWRDLCEPYHEVIVFSNNDEKKVLHSSFSMVEEIALVDLGLIDAKEEDGVNSKLENIRRNVSRSCSALCQQVSVGVIEIDPCDYPKVMAESAVYGSFDHNEIECNVPKTSYFFDENSQLRPISIQHFTDETIWEPTQEYIKAFNEGLIIGECQNFARLLHGAGVFITPEEFTKRIEDQFSGLENVMLICRNEAWMQKMDMMSILQVAWMNRKCSDQGKFYDSFQVPCSLLEIHYEGSATSKPVLLVGRSSFYHPSESYFITKKRQPLHLVQNVSGGASIAATILALARLQAPIHVKGIVVICTHSFSWRKTSHFCFLTACEIFSKVPDSHEERLILRDAVMYARSFEPEITITLATQTNYLTEAFQSFTSILYASHDSVADTFLKVCVETGERFFRLPFVDIEDDTFEKCIMKKQFCNNCREVFNCSVPPETKDDLINYIGREDWDFCFITSACLKPLLKDEKWLHLELNRSLLIQENCDNEVYALHEITGSPTRSLISFIQTFCS